MRRVTVYSLLLAAILGLVWFVTAGGPATVTLEDGKTVNVVDFTFGTEHRGRERGRLAGAVYPLLPAPLRPPFEGRPLGHVQTEAAGLVLWLAPQPVQYAPYHRPYYAAARDEHGCERPLLPVIPARGAAACSLGSPEGLPEQFTLRLYRDEAVQQLRFAAEALVRRPRLPGALTRADLGSPAALPTAKQAGGVTFTLAEVRAGVARPGRPAEEGAPRGTLLTFEATEAGRPAPGWATVSVTVSDASGNRLTPRSHSSDAGEGRSTTWFAGQLCDREAAWQVRATFVRRSYWRVSGMPLPPAGGAARSGARAVRQGRELQLLGISASGSEFPGSAANSPLEDVAALHLSVRPWRPGELAIWLIRGVTESGVELPAAVPHSATVGSPGGDLMHVRLPLAIREESAERLDFTLQLDRTLEAEFVVAPPGR